MNKKKLPHTNPNLKNLNVPNLLALGLCVAALVTWLFVLIRKYYYFGYSDWDLAFFTQGMWNLLHGSQYSSLFGLKLFANHSNFIAIILLPVFALFTHPMTLVILKLLSYVSGAYVLFLIGKDKIGTVCSLFIIVLYLIYPSNIFAMAYEFHFESLSPLFLFLLFYFFEKKRYRNFIVAALITILIKENMPLIITAFGIYALFTKGRNKIKWGVIPIVLGFISFYLLTSVIIPHIAGSNTHTHIAYYQSYGKTPVGIIFSILKNPFQIIGVILRPQNIKLLSALFFPVAYLSLLSPHILFLCSPLFLQHLLSGAATQHTPIYHYYISLTPFIFIACIYSLKLFKRILPGRFKKWGAPCLIVLMLIFSVTQLMEYKNIIHFRTAFKKDHLHAYRQHFLKSIPKDASVIASFDFLAPLSMRKNLYSFHKIFDNQYQTPTSQFKPPANTKYALIDLNDGWLLADFKTYRRLVALRIQNFLEDGWSVTNAAENIILLTRGETDQENKLVEKSRIPFLPDKTTALATIDKNFSLSAIEPIKTPQKTKSLIPITFYWEAHQDIRDTYLIGINFEKNGRSLERRNRHIGYTAYTTSTWKAGEHIKEQYWLHLPTLPPGKYAISVAFFNLSKNELAEMTFPESPKDQPSNRVILKQFIIR